MPIRFWFAPRKAVAAIWWMLEQHSPLDLHTVLKSCYFADKDHLNRHGRPIFGATYRAMCYGPLPLEIYEMMKGDPLFLPETGLDAWPWRLSGYRLERSENAPVDLDDLSETDMSALTESFARTRSMTFDQRTAATHGPDWQAARLGPMRYEDMFDADLPDRAERITNLKEIACR